MKRKIREICCPANHSSHGDGQMVTTKHKHMHCFWITSKENNNTASPQLAVVERHFLSNIGSAKNVIIIASAS